MSENKDIIAAKETISREIAALRCMEGMLDDTLTSALDLMQNCNGRVIVTGMGKSGHIARKIAATLASTGTPSFDTFSSTFCSKPCSLIFVTC